MKQANLKGKWALVTGASSGLGVDFAKNLSLIHISEPTRPY